MKTASFVLGLIGGITGVLFGTLAIAVGGIGNAVDEGSGTRVIILGFSAIASAVLALVCAGLVNAGTRLGAAAPGLAVAGVWHIVSISWFGIPGGVLMLVAALLGVLEWRSRRAIVF